MLYARRQINLLKNNARMKKIKLVVTVNETFLRTVLRWKVYN